MSGPDEADQDKGFLARWSQRKQEAKQPEPTPDAPAAESAEIRPAPAAEGEDVTPEFDLSSLPKLEELTGSTDITAFLRKGVPEHLRNAALRKSWALDPAIRNYVNPALEYAYDWNTPGGVPGGGELGRGRRCRAAGVADHGRTGSRNDKSERKVPKMRRQVLRSQPSERDLPAKPQQDLPVQSVRSGRMNRRRKRRSRFNGRKRCRRTRACRRIPADEVCCAATASATSWHRKTDCLDKSFCGHRQSLCYRSPTWNNSSSKL